MKIIIEKSPYGDEGKTYDGILGMFNHYILQLESFRSHTKTKEERDYLEADILGYKRILESNSHANAENFMKTKNEERMTGVRKFANNNEIVEHLIKENLWETKTTNGSGK